VKRDKIVELASWIALVAAFGAWALTAWTSDCERLIRWRSRPAAREPWISRPCARA
jgi:hypothetical protein